MEIPSYINNWLEIIENMNTDNTYKLAWGRSILECIHHKSYNEDTKVSISFEDIAKNMIKYYWNQLFFFNLKQSSYTTSSPVIVQQVTLLINKYKELTNSEIPVWFDKGLMVLKDNFLFTKVVTKVVKTLHLDVCWRFKNVNSIALEIYEYNNPNSFIYIEKENIDLLNQYNIILSELLNFKWSQLLEDYNHQPKIVSKVKGISNSTLKRNSLTKYKNLLLNQFKDGEVFDFYTNECINVEDISIDHVIPWSFMYSDDIWNLVITTRSYNSSKSNSVPSEEVITKLKERNTALLTILQGSSKDELQYAIDNKLVDKYYYDFKV